MCVCVCTIRWICFRAHVTRADTGSVEMTTGAMCSGRPARAIGRHPAGVGGDGRGGSRVSRRSPPAAPRPRRTSQWPARRRVAAVRYLRCGWSRGFTAMRGDRYEHDTTMNQFGDEYFYTADYHHPTVAKYEPPAEYHHSVDNGEYFGQSAVAADHYYYDAAAVGHCSGYGPYDNAVTPSSSTCNNRWSSAQDYCSPGAAGDGQPYVCGWTPPDSGSQQPLQALLPHPPPSVAIPELTSFCGGGGGGDDRRSVEHQADFSQQSGPHHRADSDQTLADQYFSKYRTYEQVRLTTLHVVRVL